MKSWLRVAVLTTVAAVLATSFAGCAPSQPQQTQAVFRPHIVVVLGIESPSYAASLKSAAEAAAKELDVILIWRGETLNGTAAQQQKLLMALGPKQYEGYVIMPIDQSLQGYVNMIADTGADVVTLDSRVSDLTKVFANIFDDANSGGIKMADAIAKSIGYQKGKSYEIAVGLVNQNDQVTQTRLAGFNYELEAKYPGIKVVATAVSGSKPGKAATQVETAFGKSAKLDGFVALDYWTATAAAAFVSGNKLRTALVAYDASPELVKSPTGSFSDLISQVPAQKIRLALQLISDHQRTGAVPQMRDQMFGNVIIDEGSSKADLKKYSYLPAN